MWHTLFLCVSLFSSTDVQGDIKKARVSGCKLNFNVYSSKGMNMLGYTNEYKCFLSILLRGHEILNSE